MLVRVILVLNLCYFVLACVSRYSEIETEFLNNETNIEKLQDIFFPVNSKGTTFAIVNYVYYDSNETLVMCPPGHKVDSKWHHFVYSFRENCIRSDQDVSMFCRWSWTDSAVHVLYGPRDLQVLAYTLNVMFPHTNRNLMSTVTLQVENICSNVTFQHLLKLTSRVIYNYTIIMCICLFISHGCLITHNVMESFNRHYCYTKNISKGLNIASYICFVKYRCKLFYVFV